MIDSKVLLPLHLHLAVNRDFCIPLRHYLRPVPERHFDFLFPADGYEVDQTAPKSLVNCYCIGIELPLSCRRMDRRPVTKVRPALRLTATWLIPSMRYSTGSSRVMMFFSGWFSSARVAYRVVVLPLPVGPVTRTRP